MTRLIPAVLISCGLVWCAPRVALAQAAPAPGPKPPAASLIRAPGDSDVALCVDGTWIKTPGAAADCGTHGGLKVAMPRKAPPPTPGQNPAAFVNTKAATVTPPPANATAQCKDGTYLTGTLPANPCSDHGGLVVTMPARPAPPPKKPPQR